ncbi:MAG TPA: exodeoxyribonuclease VII small subunit [Caldithrix sp.]|nr:exodeoxyribonuclease VII small subunit [Caldithrix sp.]
MPKQTKTFESALKRLEEIVTNMESGEISLDDSIKALEEGNELIKYCLGKLDDVEKKVQKLNNPDE